VAGCAVALAVGLASGQSALAAGGITVTPPASATVRSNATAPLNGAGVSDSDGSADQLQVTIAAGSGAVTVLDTTGLTLTDGSFSDAATMSFTGADSDVNNGLASLQYTAPGADGADTVTITAVRVSDSSQDSQTTNITVADPPSPPFGISANAASAAGSQATVSWTAPANDGGSPIMSYQAEAFNGATLAGTCATSGATSCTISGLTDGTSYGFEVVAANAIGPSSPGEGPPATVLGPPAAPSGLTIVSVSADGSQVDLSWNPPSSDGGSAITGYTATASPGDESCTTVTTSCSVSGLTDGDPYTFVVVATNALGSSPQSNAVSSAPSSPPPASASTSATTTPTSTTPTSTTTTPTSTATTPTSTTRTTTAVTTGRRGGGSSSGGTPTGAASVPALAQSPATAAPVSQASAPAAGSAQSATAGVNAPSHAQNAVGTHRHTRSRKRQAAAGQGRRHRGGAARRPPGAGQRAGTGEREIGGVRYRIYDPSSPANARQTGDTEVAVFTLLGMLALGGGLGAITGGFPGVALPARLEDEDEASTGSRSAGHGRSGNTLSNAKVKHVKFRHEAKALGDRSATWVSPLVDRIDGLSLVIPVWLNRYSPLAARLSNDGAYARAIVGSRALILPLLGLIGGITAGLGVHGAAVPPALWLLAAIVVVATLDASAGFVAALAYTLVVILAGGIYGAAAVRTLLAVDMIFFAGTLAASASRPLRRVPARAAAEWYDRAADLVVGCLIGMWAIDKMVGALSAIAGVSLPIADQGDTLALVFGAAMVTRYLLESAAAHWYPARLAEVAPPKIGFPSARQQVASAAIKTAVYVFFAYAYIGWAWELYVGAALFFVPSVIGAYQAKLPNWSGAVRWLPAGVIKVVVMLIVGKACATLLYDHVSSKTVFVDLGFVLLGLPSLLLGVVGFFAREGETFVLNWTYRLGGAGLVVFAVLVVQGVVPIK
jgi:Fibronectin type III domain